MAHYRTIVLSDIHIGIKDSKAKEITKWLKSNTADYIILNGDIIDFSSIIAGKKKWKKKYTRFFIRLLKIWEKNKKTKIYYLYGNHDEVMREFLPMQMENFYIQKELVHYSANGNNYLITHGDIFDVLNKSRFNWISHLGSISYEFLLFINRLYNKWRIKKGLKYKSLSQKIKSKIKEAVKWINNFEETLAKIAKEKGYQGVICGHIHNPENKMIDGIHYLNSGDWVESMSVLTEDFEGNWQIIYYEDKDTDDYSSVSGNID